MTLILGIASMLAGCPMATYYKIISENQTDVSNAYFVNNNMRLEIKGGHPWLEKKGYKMIVINVSIENTNTKDSLLFSHYDMHLASSEDKYLLNTSKEITSNNYFMNETSIRLAPLEKMGISFFFRADKKYTVHSFNKSVKEEILNVSVNGCSQKYYLKWSGHVMPL